MVHGSIQLGKSNRKENRNKLKKFGKIELKWYKGSMHWLYVSKPKLPLQKIELHNQSLSY